MSSEVTKLKMVTQLIKLNVWAPGRETSADISCVPAYVCVLVYSPKLIQ